MRVTNQQVLNQMLTDVKKIESQNNGTLEKGQVIKAVVQEVMSDSLLLALKSGELVRTNLPEGQVYTEGSSQSFEVLESNKEGLTIVKPFSDASLETLEKTLEGLFKGTGEAITPEKLSAAKALVNFGVPLSRESVKELMTTAKQVDTLKGLIESDIIKLNDIPPKAPVKQILVAHYAQTGGGSENNSDDLTKLLNNMDKVSGDKTTSQLTGQIKQNVETMDSKMALDSKTTLETTGKLLELLKNVDFQKLAFHKSSNLNSTVQNLAMLDKLVFGNEPIGKQIQALIQTVNDSIDTLPEDVKVLLKSLEGLGVKNNEEVDEMLSKLVSKLGASRDDSGEVTNAAMKDQVTSIQQSVNYMKDLNESMSYVQLPLQMNDEMRSVDFFIKKRNKKDKENEDTTIFISLDTNELKTVQVLVEYKKSDVGIQFRLSDTEILDILRVNVDGLNEKLTELSDKKFNVQFRLKEQSQNNLDVIAEMTDHASSIDMKV